MSTACDNFKPHRWKPRQCAACFKPKAEHSGITSEDSSNDQSNNSAKVKQSPYYKKFSFSDENNVDQNASSRDREPTQTSQQSTAPTSRDTVVTGTANKLEKPDSGHEADETYESHSSSLPAAVVESTCSESVPTERAVNNNIDDNSRVTSEVTSDSSDMSGKTPPRPPPPRARSHTMAVPQVKPRKHQGKHVPEPSADLQLSTKTLSRDLPPVPAPRRNRSNRSTSPIATSNSLDEESSVFRAKSLDNLDVSPPSDRRVKFKEETTTIPDPDTSTAARKSGMIEPYAISEVTDILQRTSTVDEVVVENKKGLDKQVEDNDEHEYIEADQLHAAVVSVTELKNQHRNGNPSLVTKYSTLSTLQPTQQQNGKLVMGTKQKALSSGTITTTKTTPRRHAPPPPGAPRSRSATIASVDKIRMQNYSTPRRPPPPAVYYSNSNVVNSSKVNAAPVAKVPPPKPMRTPNTFDYENVNGKVTTETVEYSIIDNDKEMAATSNVPTSSRPKKPVRMPKEASPVPDGGQPPSQPKGRYIDLDIDQLNDQHTAGRQVMKYQNFDDFSPRPISPEHSRTPECFDVLVSLPLEASQIHDAILNSLNVASVELTKFYFHKFSFVGKMACSKWSDFDPAPPGTTGCVKYNGKLLSLQDISKERVDGEKATPLPPHPNICRAMAFFTDNPPSKLIHKFKIKKGRIAAITDCVPMATVAEFVKQNFVSMKQLEYDRHVLLILVQLFSAIKHLQQNGTVHRDLSAETCRYDPESGIMKLTDFTYALHRPPPITSSTFIYGYAELKWLGGTGSKLPPEIINTPDDCQILDYSMSDCFAVGCMIYELFGMQPPFDKDEKLIGKNYTISDLVHIPKRSQYSNLINQLIYLLVQADKSKRIKPHDALLLVQTILWGPVSWLHDSVSETAIQSYLAVEKARLVTSIALNSLKGDGKPSVELMLKNMFIQDCNPANMINALSLLNTE